VIAGDGAGAPRADTGTPLAAAIPLLNLPA
jgi:hypothetical protein